jgi:uncharacterized protein (DUF427 family)
MVAASTGTLIRAYIGDILIASSRDTLLFRESSYKLFYAFPREAFAEGTLQESDRVERSGYRGEQRFFHLVAGAVRKDDAAYEFTEVKNDRPDLRGFVIMEWDAVDRWMEEEETLIGGHPRDPYTRIDIRRTTRKIRLEIDGIVVAETSRPLALTETGLPVRYYIPREDMKWDVLVPSETRTTCPYKGVASYWSVKDGDKNYPDLIWAYPDPFEDAERVRDAFGYYHEKMTVTLDGEVRERLPVFFAK